MNGWKSMHKGECDCVECRRSRLKNQIKNLKKARDDTPLDNQGKRYLLLIEIAEFEARLDRLNRKKRR